MIYISKSTDTPTRIKELVKNLAYLYTTDTFDQVTLDSFGFVTPLAITPLAAMINQKELRYDKSQNTSYLHTINFPEGAHLKESHKQKHYFPIIRLDLAGMPSIEQAFTFEQLHSYYLELLSHNIVADKQFLALITNNTFGFVLGEIFTNIQEHAQAKNAYIFAQYWEEENACEICIVDDGQGLYASLKNAGRSVQNSYDALYQVISTGLSAKTEYGSILRGTGLKHTRACIANQEINGEFFILSGDAAFLHAATHGETFYRLSRYFWQGTIVMLRIHKPLKDFSIFNYVK